MAVLFWYLKKKFKSNFSSVRYCTTVYWTNNSLTFFKVPEQHGHVYLVGL